MRWKFVKNSDDWLTKGLIGAIKFGKARYTYYTLPKILKPSETIWEKIVPTVLILDDDPAQLQLCRMILQSLQCRIVTTQSSDEALRLLTTVKPDVLILDFLMPQVNGVDFLLSLRKDDQFKGLRVLGLTAAPDLVESARNSDLPLWDMLMKKPFEIDKLRQAVQRLLTPKT